MQTREVGTGFETCAAAGSLAACPGRVHAKERRADGKSVLSRPQEPERLREQLPNRGGAHLLLRMTHPKAGADGAVNSDQLDGNGEQRKSEWRSIARIAP